MKLIKSSIEVVLVALLAASPLYAGAECRENTSGGGNELVGTLLGAAIGGLVGSQVGSGTGNKVAIGAGVLAGGMLGSKVAKSMNCQDQSYHNETAQNALENETSGSTSSWNNPDSGAAGTVTPMRTYQREDGTYCREFEQTISVEGSSEQAYGTACRQPDGSWKIVSR